MIAFTLSLRCRWNPSIASRMCGLAMHLLSEFGHDQCREWQIEMAFCLHYIIDIHNLRQNTAKINYIGEKQHVVASLTWYTSLFRCVVTSQTWLVHFPLHMVTLLNYLVYLFRFLVVPVCGSITDLVGVSVPMCSEVSGTAWRLLYAVGARRLMTS